MSNTLDRAIRVWQSGQPIDLCLAAALMQQGYDVERLERQYLNNNN